MKDVFAEGEAIAQLYRRFDPKLSHIKNPSKEQFDEAFNKLSEKLKTDPDAMILFAYSGHSMDAKGKLLAILDGDLKTGQYPMEDKLTALGTQTNVHGFFNSNRVYANYSEQQLQAQYIASKEIRDSNVTFVYSARTG